MRFQRQRQGVSLGMARRLSSRRRVVARALQAWIRSVDITLLLLPRTGLQIPRKKPRPVRPETSAQGPRRPCARRSVQGPWVRGPGQGKAAFPGLAQEFFPPQRGNQRQGGGFSPRGGEKGGLALFIGLGTQPLVSPVKKEARIGAGAGAPPAGEKKRDSPSGPTLWGRKALGWATQVKKGPGKKSPWVACWGREK